MDTLQIKRALRGLRAASIGVYAADRIPRTLSLPAAIVANTDASDKSGSHWVAFYVDKNAFATFFDSYGFPPSSPFHLERLKKNCARFQCNRKKLQSVDSQVCGEYCIMFLYHMCSGISLRSFVNLFSSNTRSNDRTVSKFYKDIIKKLEKNKRQHAVNNFPLDSSLGSGIRILQYCTPKICR